MARLLPLVLVAAAVCGGALGASNPLGPYKVDRSKVTVGGLSSGAFFAVQYHVAHSSQISGASVFAGGPYMCAQGQEVTALTTCMSPNLVYPAPNASDLEVITDLAFAGGNIDDPANMTNAKVYIYSGEYDSTVARSVVTSLQTYYEHYVTGGQVNTEYTIGSGHCFPTLSYGEICALTMSPYIGDCEYDGAGVSLQALYGTLKPAVTAVTANLLSFDQSQFVSNPSGISLGDTGYIYVPTACQNGATCAVHANFHGCQQTVADIQLQYPTDTGLNGWAEANNIIVVYPQVIKSELIPANPEGCWDWWGYTGSDYAYQSGPQIQFVAAVLQAIGA